MFSRNICAAALACLLAGPVYSADQAATEQGKLIWRDDTCFFFVLQFKDGFGLYEFLGGPSPMVGHTFEGNLRIFGTRKIMNLTENKATMAYSETFTDTKGQMEKKIPRQCRKKKSFEELSLDAAAESRS